MLVRGRKARLRGEEGQSSVEYGLLIALGAVALIACLLFLAGNVDELLRRTGSETSTFRPPAVRCDASYSGVCIPPRPPDLDCTEIRSRGIRTPVTVVPPDPHNLDPDGDGYGCD
jgi:Flp pilus assembly pilin Flp